MGLPYQVVFFYGRLLTEEDIMILLKQIEKYKPPLNDWRAEGKYKMEGFDEKASIEAWYSDIRHNDYDWIEDLETLFSGQVQIKIIATASKEEPVEFYLIINNMYNPIWDSDFQNHCSFYLEINTAKWDKYIRKACESHELPWQQPKFYLVIDYNMENYLHSFAYHGVLFYGTEVTNIEFFTKKIIEKEKLWMEDNVWEEDLYEMFDYVNNMWQEKHDPIYLGIIGTREHGIEYRTHMYLALRATHHSVDVDNDENSFESLEIDKLEGDRLLRERCMEYGLEYTSPAFHMFIDDCF